MSNAPAEVEAPTLKAALEMLRNGFDVQATTSGKAVVVSADGEIVATILTPQFHKGDTIHVPPMILQSA